MKRWVSWVAFAFVTSTIRFSAHTAHSTQQPTFTRSKSKIGGDSLPPLSLFRSERGAHASVCACLFTRCIMSHTRHPKYVSWIFFFLFFFVRRQFPLTLSHSTAFVKYNKNFCNAYHVWILCIHTVLYGLCAATHCWHRRRHCYRHHRHHCRRCRIDILLHIIKEKSRVQFHIIIDKELGSVCVCRLFVTYQRPCILHIHIYYLHIRHRRRHRRWCRLFKYYYYSTYCMGMG